MVEIMAKGFGASGSTGFCSCEVKDKSNWEIVGYAGKKKIVYCYKCHSQWSTAAKYVEELSKSTLLK